MTRHPGRSGAAWERVRRLVLSTAHLCGICGKEIDHTAPPRSRWAPSVDHIIPISKMQDLDAETQRALALDPAYLRGVHFGCNARRGNRPIRQAQPPRRTSRQW